MEAEYIRVRKMVVGMRCRASLTIAHRYGLVFGSFILSSEVKSTSVFSTLVCQDEAAYKGPLATHVSCNNIAKAHSPDYAHSLHMFLSSSADARSWSSAAKLLLLCKQKRVVAK